MAADEDNGVLHQLGRDQRKKEIKEFMEMHLRKKLKNYQKKESIQKLYLG